VITSNCINQSGCRPGPSNTGRRRR
jgi:hypothetical protein